jgi:hypothetical protein
MKKLRAYSLPTLCLLSGLWFLPVLFFLSAFVAAASVATPLSTTPLPQPGALLYEADMRSRDSVADWVMEGAAQTAFRAGWMEIYSPDKAEHHVFWCSQEFPASFIATWEVQNLAIDSGLLIVFFAAKGAQGQDIFDPSLPTRDGTFTHYTEGKIKSYHISYYANVAHEPGRAHANLRKNNTFSLLQSGAEGIPTHSRDIHQIKLIKHGAHIRLLIDERPVIDYMDDKPLVNGVNTGPALGAGKIGLRQMQWSHFRYRNFKVWEIAEVK